jgi:hypothetical protein
MKYGKALAAVAYAVLLAAHALGAGIPSAEGWVQLGFAAATAVGVYFVPLFPDAPWLKTAVASVLAVLQVASTALVGGVDSAEVVLAIAAALGVWLAPAESEHPDGSIVAVGVGPDTRV